MTELKLPKFVALRSDDYKTELKLPKFVAPRSDDYKTEQKIPRRIFQTWNSFTTNVKELHDRVMKLINDNPEYEYNMFDDDESLKFIKENFKKEVADAYENVIPGAYKADLWRYCVLYIHGGVYLDIKKTK